MYFYGTDTDSYLAAIPYYISYVPYHFTKPHYSRIKVAQRNDKAHYSRIKAAYRNDKPHYSRINAAQRNDKVAYCLKDRGFILGLFNKMQRALRKT